MDERETIQLQIEEAQARLAAIDDNEKNEAKVQEDIEFALAEGYEGNPPPGEWVQHPDAEFQLEDVAVEET